MNEFEELEIIPHHGIDDNFKPQKRQSIEDRTMKVVFIGIFARKKSIICKDFDIAEPEVEIYAVFSIKKKKLSEYHIAVKDGKYLDLAHHNDDLAHTHHNSTRWKIANRSSRKPSSKPNVLDKLMIDKLLEEL
jgi:hypothetical protein